MEHPGEEKYRKLRRGTGTYAEIAAIPECLNLLQYMGFKPVEEKVETGVITRDVVENPDNELYKKVLECIEKVLKENEKK